MLKLANRQSLENLPVVDDELHDMDETPSDNVFLSQADLDNLSLDSSNSASFSKRIFSDDSVGGRGDFDLSQLLDTDTVSYDGTVSPKIEEAISSTRSKSPNNVLNARQTGEEFSGEAPVAVAATASDVIAPSQPSVSDGRTEEEERRLVLASVKHVDCHDFPFDEVLSLEETVLQKGALQHQVEPEAQSRSTTAFTEANKTMKGGGSVSIISHSPLPGSLDSVMHIAKERKSKRRPPLLKCPTWPRQDSEEEDSCNFSQTVSSSSKLDSPSFYSQSAIDFSAISHLSEEHDKMMAQEMSEKPQPQHPFISATTKERIYGKASKSRSQSQRGKGCRDTNRNSAIKISSTSSDFTVTHTKPNASIVCTRRHTVSEFNTEFNAQTTVIGGRKPSKAVMSPLEKAFRKQYSMASKTGTPVVPSITTIPTEASPPPLGAENQEQSESNKVGQMPMEKQPLPPEGFKITRYPIKANSAAVITSTPGSPNDGAETAQEGNTSESDLYEVIKKLQKQQEKADERIAQAEKQAKEWKEIAQQTLRAAQVIKAQMEFEKTRANRAEGKSMSGNNESQKGLPAGNANTSKLSQTNVHQQRRWSNDVSNNPREGITITRHRIVSMENASCAPTVKRYSPRGRKRSANVAQTSSEGLQKRARVVSVPIESNLPVEDEQQKQQSLLEWLTSTEKEAGDISYMSLLECPPTVSATIPASVSLAKPGRRIPPLAMTNRSFSHEEVRAALRAKVEHSRSQIVKSSDDSEANQSDKLYKMSNNQQQLSAVVNPDQYFSITSAKSPVASAAAKNFSSNVTNDQDDVLSDLLLSDNDCLPNSPEMSHSLSDSELQVTEKRITQTSCAKPTLSKKLSSSEGFLSNIQSLHMPVTVTTEGGKSDSDFLSQLDCLFGL